MTRDELVGKTLGSLQFTARTGPREWRATDVATKAEAIAREILPDPKTPGAAERLSAEAAALAKLDHPHIGRILGLVEAGGRRFLLFAPAKGKDAGRLLEENGPMEPARAVELVTAAAKALEAAHQKGVVHREIEPGCLVPGTLGQPAKLVGFTPPSAAPSGRAELPLHRAPEQLQGKKADEKSDVYSLGAVLFHLLTGRPPYPGATAKEVAEGHLSGKLPSLAAAGRGGPAGKTLEPIVRRMMAPAPGYRYSAKDLAAALEAVKLPAARTRGASTGAERRGGRAPAERRPSRAPLYAAGGIVGALVIAIVVVLATRGDAPAPPPTDVAEEKPAEAAAVSDAGLGDRAALRARRDSEAERLFQQARNFESANAIDYDGQVARFQEVALQYGDTAWGEKARTRVKEIVGRRDAKLIAAREAERATKKAAAEKEIAKALEDAARKYDFGAMREKLDAFLGEWGATPGLTDRRRVLDFAESYFTEIEKAVAGREIDVSRVKPGSSGRIVAASPEGLKIVDGGLEVLRPWSEFSPDDVVRLDEQVFSGRDAQTYCLRHAFLVAVGRSDRAEEALEEARMRGGMLAGVKIDEYLRRISD